MAAPQPSILSIEEIQVYIRDQAENNHLIDGSEFSATVLNLAMDLAIAEFNLIPPIGTVSRADFPNKALLLSGTLYKAFAGQAALLARNTMNYSDGGISVPVEERFQLYQTLASMYQADFMNSASKLKIFMNIESGWGGVRSDYGTMPTW